MSGYVFLFFGSLDMTKNYFSLQDERNDKVWIRKECLKIVGGRGGEFLKK